MARIELEETPAAARPRPIKTRDALGRGQSRLRAAHAQILFGLLAWAVLLMGAITVRNLTDRTVARLGLVATHDGRVVLLAPDGAAARAGIRPGDIVSAVNAEGLRGHGFSALPSATNGLVAVGVGTPGRRTLYLLSLDSLRGPSSAEAAGDGIALAAALALWVSGLMAGLPRRRDRAIRLYALAAFALSLALCALVARDGPLFWSWPVLTPALLIGLAALLGATLMLSRPRPARLSRALRALLGLGALAMALAALGAALDAYRPLPSAVASATAALLGLLALAAIVAPLALHAGAYAEPPRRRLRVALLATLLGLLPPLIWPGLTALAAVMGRAVALSPPAGVSSLWSAAGLIPMAALYGALAWERPGTPYVYAPGGVHYARRLDLYARVGLSYVLAVALCGGLLAALWPLLLFPLPVALATAALALFPFVQRGAERLIEQSVRRPLPDYDTALRLLEGLAATVTTPDQLAREVVTRLPALLQVRRVTVLLREVGEPPGRYRIVTRDSPGQGYASPSAASMEPLLAGGGAAPGALVQLDDLPDPSPADGQAGVRHGPVAARGAVSAAGLADAALWTPLRWGGAQRGLLALGPRLSGDAFDGRDLDGVASVAGVLTLAFQTLELVGHLHERTDTLVSLTHRLSHAHEQERAHLSRELHDVVAQELIALTRQLRRYGDGRAPSPEIWADMLAAAQDALAHTRRICNGLRPAILDLGLVPALRDLVSEAGERPGVTEVSLTVDGPEQRFPGEREFALFRVAQEGLSNALAHAAARQVRVEVHFDGAVRLRVRDDGRGFVAPARFEDLPGDHLGLIGMRERLAEFGGTLTVDSTPGRGTVLETCMPL
jgi:signal transduction histidine kinase